MIINIFILWPSNLPNRYRAPKMISKLCGGPKISYGPLNYVTQKFIYLILISVHRIYGDGGNLMNLYQLMTYITLVELNDIPDQNFTIISNKVS